MVYITNISKNVSVGIAGKTLKPGMGNDFEDAVAEIYGVVAAEKKGLISIEMVKSVPGGVAIPVKHDVEPVVSSDPVAENEAETGDEQSGESDVVDATETVVSGSDLDSEVMPKDKKSKRNKKR